MTATISLLLGLGFGRSAVIADIALTGAALAGVGVAVVRSARAKASGRPAAVVDHDAAPGVVAEAEAVVAATDRQPA